MKDLSKYYDEKYELIENEKLLLVPHRYNIILNELSKIEKRGKKLLDIGCGEGVLLEYAQKQGFDVMGVECSKKAVDYISKKGFDAVCLDIEDGLPFKEEFDIAIATELIEHLYDFYKFLANVNKCLRKGGLLFLSTPNSSSILYRTYCVFGKTPTEVQNPTHIRFFSFSYLLKICSDQGFKLEKDLSYAYIPFHYIMLKNKYITTPFLLSNVFASDLILMIRKVDMPKYEDMTPILERLRKQWFKPEKK
jgi:2-polyprenyl-3-methyl-5-hydroxy-6-metoxy-1,4-benzoquinol methylase